MQLCALDLNNSLVFAHQAVKHQNYACLECGQRVRLRKGAQRQAHYYHSEPNQACRQSGKGMAHLLLQHFLKDQLPSGEVHLEYRFPSIGRIADVVWLSQRLVYEIQYSPITALEVAARNADYASIGYQVVWIFFDGRYNQIKLTAAEDMLQNSPHYFTDMNDEGEGTIYDQFSMIHCGVRQQVESRLSIDLASPFGINEEVLISLQERLPRMLQERAQHWKLYFSGDSIDCYLEEGNSSSTFKHEMIDLMIEREKLIVTTLWESCKRFFLRWIAIPYRAVLRLLLERACR